MCISAEIPTSADCLTRVLEAFGGEICAVTGQAFHSVLHAINSLPSSKEKMSEYGEGRSFTLLQSERPWARSVTVMGGVNLANWH